MIKFLPYYFWVATFFSWLICGWLGFDFWYQEFGLLNIGASIVICFEKFFTKD